MAIIEYLDETYDGELKLVPATARDRSRVRALAQVIACDIHPINNLRVMQYLEREFNVPEVERERWSRHWIVEGFKALEAMLADNPSTGVFSEGDDPSLADVCLVPQVYNAKRWSVDMSAFPTIARINEECLKLAAFDRARPENQPDAPKS
jgi:maleylacetoacetate isomerase